MNIKRTDEILVFDFRTSFLGLSFFIILIIVLGLAANNFKFYAYSLSCMYIILVMYFYILENSKIKEALQWNKVSGTVINSKKIIKRCIGTRQGNVYSIYVYYKYFFDKEKIYGDAWSLFRCEKFFYTSEEADRCVNQMRSKNEIDVFVNPKNKYESYVNRDELIEANASFAGDVFLTLLVIATPLFFIAYFA